MIAHAQKHNVAVIGMDLHAQKHNVAVIGMDLPVQSEMQHSVAETRGCWRVLGAAQDTGVRMVKPKSMGLSCARKEAELECGVAGQDCTYYAFSSFSSVFRC
eukprot:3263547-Rhodomonas_salina.1